MNSESLYIRVTSIEQALQAAHAHLESFSYLAGGTDVLVNKFHGNETAKCLIDISEIQELTKVEQNESQLKIGSLVKLAELQHIPSIATTYPELIEAAQLVASPVIRKSATLGGNLLCENRCTFYNQSEWWRKAAGYCLKNNGDTCLATGGKNNCLSKFVSDTAIILISLNASIEIVDESGTSTLPLESMYTGDGIHPRNLSKTALIKSIIVSNKEKHKTIYKKLRERDTLEFGSLMTAVSVSEKGNLKMVLGGVDPKPIVWEGNIHDNVNDWVLQMSKKARAVDNDALSRKYRKEMIGVFIKKSLEELKLIS